MSSEVITHLVHYLYTGLPLKQTSPACPSASNVSGAAPSTIETTEEATAVSTVPSVRRCLFSPSSPSPSLLTLRETIQLLVLADYLGIVGLKAHVEDEIAARFLCTGNAVGLLELADSLGERSAVLC